MIMFIYAITRCISDISNLCILRHVCTSCFESVEVILKRPCLKHPILLLKEVDGFLDSLLNSNQCRQL